MMEPTTFTERSCRRYKWPTNLGNAYEATKDLKLLGHFMLAHMRSFRFLASSCRPTSATITGPGCGSDAFNVRT